jgi:hypothetical protein
MNTTILFNNDTFPKGLTYPGEIPHLSLPPPKIYFPREGLFLDINDVLNDTIIQIENVSLNKKATIEEIILDDPFDNIILDDPFNNISPEDPLLERKVYDIVESLIKIDIPSKRQKKRKINSTNVKSKKRRKISDEEYTLYDTLS